MKKRKLSILVVVNHDPTFMYIRDLLQRIPLYAAEVHRADNSPEALKLLKKNMYRVCLLDSAAKGCLDLLRAAKNAGCNAPIILLADSGDQAGDVACMKAGAADYLVRDCLDESILERSIRYALERSREREALRKSKRLQQFAKEQLQKTMLSLEEELETARMVQESLLPRDISSVNGLAVSAAYIPCGRIGGDLYDIIKIDDRRTCFVMFDVVGHGVPAALISAMVKISFSKNITRDACMAAIMERVNREIVNLFNEKRHITAFLCLYDGAAKRLDFVKGGHPSPLLLHPRERSLEYLSNGGLPLGMFADIRYEVSSMQLIPGDCLILYTDGLTECADAADALFGKKRLEDVLLTLPEESSTDDILGAIIKAQLAFSGAIPRGDDITVVVIKIP